LLVQIGAISLCACRIPLWAHAPQAGEFLAVDVLLIVQIVFAALLSPRLCNDWRTSLMAIACAWPFAVLAAILAAAPALTIVRSGIYVSAWIAVLWIWSLPFSSKTGHFTVAAVASTWAAGGPILLFIGSEYAATPFYPTLPLAISSFGPATSGPAAIHANFSEYWGIWATLAACGFLGIASFLVKTVLISRFSAHFRAFSPVFGAKKIIL
jgi:hypothetical protein